MRKIMIVLGMALLLLGLMASCKEKSEEREIEELVEKLGDAKTEKEAAEIARKIEQLEEGAKKKSIKEVRVKLGRPFTFWQKDVFGEQVTKFSVTFENISVHKEHPFVPNVVRTPKGKKHVKIIAKIKNLGPREATPESDMELKVDKGYIYNVGAFGELYPAPRYEPVTSGKEMYSLEPGQTGWILFHSEILKDTTPIEIFGTLGGSGLLSGHTKFRLRIAQLGRGKAVPGGTNKGKLAAEIRKISKDSVSGKYIAEEIPGRYIIELVKKDGTTEKDPEEVIFKRDGRLAVSSSGSESVVPDVKWEFKNGAVHFYQRSRSVFEPGWFETLSESEFGKLRGSTIIFKIKDDEQVDELRYIREDGRPFSLTPSANSPEPESRSQGKKTSGLESIEMLWVKCNNPDCEAEYQTSKRGYFEYAQKHIDPMAMVAPPAVCKKCGKESIYRAEKCGNPDCGLVFFRGTVPNDFADRCPECGYSETEEIRKRRLSGGYSGREQETKPKSVYDLWKEDEKRLRTEPATELKFKKLSIEDEIQAQRLWEVVITQRKMARLPAMVGYKQMVHSCREIIRRWPESEYAFKAKRALADLPERFHKMYNITKKETDLSNFYQTPAMNKQELVDALEDVKRAMVKKIHLEVDVTAQCFTSVKEYRRAKWLADVLRPVLRVIQGTLSVLSLVGDATTLSGQVRTSLDNAQYVSEAASVIFMINGLREAGEKLHYAIDGPTYVNTVENMLKTADSTTVVRVGPGFEFKPENYNNMIKMCLHDERDSPLIIARTSDLAPDQKPAYGALMLHRIIRDEFSALIEQIQGSDLPLDFPVEDVVAEIEQLKRQVVETGVRNLDVRYSIYHRGSSVEQYRKLGAVAEHNKAFAAVASALANRLKIEIYAECAQLAATGADIAYIVTYNVRGAGEAVKMTQQVSILPQIVIEGEKTFTVDPENEFYQMPQEMLFSLAIEFSNLWRIADDTVYSLTQLLREANSLPLLQRKPERIKEQKTKEIIETLFNQVLKKR